MLRKKLENLKKITKIFLYDCKHYSFKVAIGRLYWNLPITSWERRQHKYEESVLNYLKKKYSGVISEYTNVPFYSHSDISSQQGKRIWVMWWQGEEQMPHIVKACYNSIKSAANGATVTLITEKNYRQYVDVSESLVNRANNGTIPFADFSDFIRVALLDLYGGLWIDATVLCTDIITEDFWKQNFYTLYAPNLFPCFISRGEWSSFLLYARMPESSFFHALRICLNSYYTDHDVPVDYLLIDYFARIIIDSNIHFQKELNRITVNADYYLLNPRLNENFNENDYNVIIQKSPFHKLTYKNIDFENKNSLYFKLLEIHEWK